MHKILKQLKMFWLNTEYLNQIEVEPSLITTELMNRFIGECFPIPCFRGKWKMEVGGEDDKVIFSFEYQQDLLYFKLMYL